MDPIKDKKRKGLCIAINVVKNKLNRPNFASIADINWTMTKTSLVSPNPPQKNVYPHGLSYFLAVLFWWVLWLYLSLSAKDATDIVVEQIDALKEDNINGAYYNYTAKGFQDTVSLDHFRKFAAQYPAFSHNRSVRFIDRQMDVSNGYLDAILTTTQGDQMRVKYRMVKEGDKWKILSIKFQDSKSVIAEAEEVVPEQMPSQKDRFDPDPILAPIKEQVQHIRESNITQAYLHDTSTEFQKVTSLQDFTKFIQEHPGFAKNKSVKYENLKFDNNMAIIKVVLTSTQGHDYPIQYSVVNENGKWKIIHIEVLSHDAKNSSEKSQTEQKESLQFNKFDLGTQVNQDGLVTNPGNAFKSDSGILHLNLYLTHAIAGTEVDVLFEHLESHSNAEPLSVKVPDDGDIILSFAFSPEDSGWPKGSYRIQAKSSTGRKKSFEFKIE